ncbi:MvaI/BcnI family restriction endonuclease [Colwellia demingiae]|uniref:MvaI/BcnI family restriction endonuclease n=1 Tax=Colwellia demingiae TaxID=89401 RepID=UPI001FE62CD9|nr:MvaI/BcnI family restriction endonuclease [Colwellia demingiae]
MKNLSTYKKEAKAFQKKHDLKLHQAQLLIANEYNFGSWTELVKACDDHNIIKLSTSTKKELSEGMSNEDAINKALVVSVNKKLLVSKGIDFVIFEPTPTGLKKSILDATHPVRHLFRSAAFHDYDSQGQGPEHKVMKTALFIGNNECKNSLMSLYRPVTKQGDPRMWFRGLGDFAEAGDQVALIFADEQLVLVNLSTLQLAEGGNELTKLQELLPNDESVAIELLNKLRDIAKGGLIKATLKGSTAIGMAIEDALGVPPNSSKLPDYKGIELKSGRGNGSRTTLFAQVADWKISPLKSSAAILDAFGYQREVDFKLYCTISAKKPNSQGLQFTYDEKIDQLIEHHNKEGDVAFWPADLLRDRLLEKHKETFWIDAESIEIDGHEYFKLKSVTHTKNPMVSQLMPLLADGTITMDHLIKRKGGDKPKVSEKGPLFKMNKKDLALLFPTPVKHCLEI